VPQFGQPIALADAAPDGAGLPGGRGTAAQGEAVYAAKCQACHGEKGAGRPNDTLVGGAGTLAPGKAPVKTVGSLLALRHDAVRLRPPRDVPGPAEVAHSQSPQIPF
jgi:mono/diheme cytochrome c family protein